MTGEETRNRQDGGKEKRRNERRSNTDKEYFP